MFAQIAMLAREAKAGLKERCVEVEVEVVKRMGEGCRGWSKEQIAIYL